ncbi:ATP-binding protein [Pseudoalteromonas sp. bablab_jr010]|uniref:hybrid sensor histidine kinase/response regulator n=1 Tax=Pseudoalteromonas sp. bablab_jr010 TaxID=2755063 RepID=UPI0018F3DCB2|nr:ATP-binding protein [Pseudoalteromonas sp. bablab_jr010]
MSLRILVLFFFWLCNAQAIEQLSPYAAHWDTTKGLVHNSVYDIEKDMFGRLWLASPGGVSIVDGLGVIQLKKSNHQGQGLRFNPVTQIHALNKKMWVLGLGGIEIVDPKSLNATSFPDPNKELQRVTNMLFIDESLAYVVANRQLIKLNLKTNTISVVKHKLYEDAQVNSFARYDQNHILLMTSSGLVLFNWQSGKHRLFNLENLARGKEDIRAMAVDLHNQNVWLSIFNKGIYVYDNNNRLKAHLNEKTSAFPSNMISNLDVKGDDVYAVTQRGIVVLDSKTATMIKLISPSSINDNFRQASMALSAEIDINNELFIGTTNGFYYVSPLAYEFKSLKVANPQFTPPILTQYIHQDELVIVTPTQNFRFSDKHGWRKQQSHLASQGLRYFTEQTIAVRNFQEIARLENKQYQYYPVQGRPDPNAPISYVKELSEQNLFIIIDDKYIHLSKLQSDSLIVQQSFPLELASVIDTAFANGVLYISSQRHGVMTLNLHQWVNGRDIKLQALSGPKAATNLFLASNNVLWITTLDEGVYTLDTKMPHAEISLLTIANKEFTPPGNCITEDKAKRIWISSRQGVSVYDPKQQYIHSFTGSNGLGAIPATENCGRVDKFIYLSNREDLLIVDPEKLLKEQENTSLSLTNLSIDGASQELQDGAEFTDPSVIEFALSATLPPASGDSLLYRLVGAQAQPPQWLTSRSRYITLIKPKPGQYTLQAKLINYDGLQKAYVESHFKVQPPLYLRPSMIALYIAFIIIAIALGFTFKLRLKNAELAISELKHQEQKSYALELAKQVEAKTQLYKEQQQIAVKANLDKTRFIASASHDLRAPLNAIRLKLLEILPKSTSIRETILGEITLLDRLVDSIVSLSKFDAKMIKPSKVDVNLCELSMQSIQRFKDMAKQKSQHLTFNSQCDEIWLFTDPFLLARVINNLIDNAIKNTPEHGLIEVLITKTDNNGLTFAIKDSGKGIDNNIRDKIFNSFVRGTHRYAGSGLGLTIVHQICLILELNISLQSTIKGCTFSLSFPSKLISSKPSQIAISPTTVLIIDDDPAYANDVASMVKRRGFTPKVMTSAVQALIYEGPTPALIISDLHLDNGAIGFDIATQLADRFSLAQNNIIIMSEDVRVRDQVKSNFGYRFLSKPIKYSRLSWLIQQIKDKQKDE